MLAPNGEVIGVLSIFSPNPRKTFSSLQRRELTTFSEYAVEKLCHNAHSSHLRETPILQRRSLIDEVTTFDPAISICRLSDTSIADTFVPPTSHRHKRITGSEDALVFDTTKHTPPASDDESPNPNTKGLGKNHKLLCLDRVDTTNDITDANMMTPDSQFFNSLPSRPFSGSDLTSVDQNARPCTPEPGLVRGPAPWKMSAKDLANRLYHQDRVADQKEEFNTPDSPTLGSGFETPPRSIGNHLSTRDSFGNLGGSRFRPIRDLTQSIPSGFAAPYSQEHLDYRIEANFAVELWAKRLCFDVIYVVELIPTANFLSDEELKQPGGMETRLLTSYGLTSDLVLDIGLHLAILRSKGDATVWENNSIEGYSRGLLMPLTMSGNEHSEKCSSGVIFGAFRKMKDISVNTAGITGSELERLVSVGWMLESIVRKGSQSRRPSHANSEPPPSLFENYPANEATEIGKHSLDAGMLRIGSAAFVD
jgi:hypothetical protein